MQAEIEGKAYQERFNETASRGATSAPLALLIPVAHDVFKSTALLQRTGVIECSAYNKLLFRLSFKGSVRWVHLPASSMFGLPLSGVHQLNFEIRNDREYVAMNSGLPSAAIMWR